MSWGKYWMLHLPYSCIQPAPWMQDTKSDSCAECWRTWRSLLKSAYLIGGISILIIFLKLLHSHPQGYFLGIGEALSHPLVGFNCWVFEVVCFNLVFLFIPWFILGLLPFYLLFCLHCWAGLWWVLRFSLPNFLIINFINLIIFSHPFLCFLPGRSWNLQWWLICLIFCCLARPRNWAWKVQSMHQQPWYHC